MCWFSLRSYKNVFLLNKIVSVIWCKTSLKYHLSCFLHTLINFNIKGSGKLEALQGQQSHRIESFVKANCWGIFPGGKERFKSGNVIECVNLIPIN